MNIKAAVDALKKKIKEPEEEPKKPGLFNQPLVNYLDDIGMVLKGLKSASLKLSWDNASSVPPSEPPTKISESNVMERMMDRFTPKRLPFKKRASDDDDQNTIGTVLESRIHEGFTVAADRLMRSGVLNRKERIALSKSIGDVLRNLKARIPREIHGRKMTELAHEHLKHAVSERFIRTRLVARDLANRKSVSEHAITESAKALQGAPLTDPAGNARKALRGAIRFTHGHTESKPVGTTDFVGRLKKAIGTQENLPG